MKRVHTSERTSRDGLGEAHGASFKRLPTTDGVGHLASFSGSFKRAPASARTSRAALGEVHATSFKRLPTSVQAGNNMGDADGKIGSSGRGVPLRAAVFLHASQSSSAPPCMLSHDMHKYALL